MAAGRKARSPGLLARAGLCGRGGWKKVHAHTVAAWLSRPQKDVGMLLLRQLGGGEGARARNFSGTGAVSGSAAPLSLRDFSTSCSNLDGLESLAEGCAGGLARRSVARC